MLLAPRGAQTAPALRVTNCCKSFRLQSVNKHRVLLANRMLQVLYLQNNPKQNQNEQPKHRQHALHAARLCAQAHLWQPTPRRQAIRRHPFAHSTNRHRPYTHNHALHHMGKDGHAQHLPRHRARRRPSPPLSPHPHRQPQPTHPCERQRVHPQGADAHHVTPHTPPGSRRHPPVPRLHPRRRRPPHGHHRSPRKGTPCASTACNHRRMQQLKKPRIKTTKNLQKYHPVYYLCKS